MRLKRVICIITVLLLLALTACSPRGSGKSIVYAIDSSPSTLDPQYSQEPGAQMIINNVFEGLVRKDENGEIIKGLAKEWTVSDDGLVWTFTIDKTTEWYCPSSVKTEFGEEFYKKFASEKVTAYDFEYACMRTVDPATGSPLASRMTVISGAADIHDGKADMSALGVKAEDEATLQFTLTENSPDFLERLTESEFMPCNREFFEATKGRYGLTAKHILCNGPFYLSYWDAENGLTIKKNNYYAGSQTVNPASVTISFDSDTESVYKKLSNGTLTAAMIPPGSELPEGVNIVKEISNTTSGFIFNCSDPVLKNANIRKALCSSIDRSLFPVTDNTVTSESGFVPRSCLAGSKSYREIIGDQTPVIEYNPEKAVKYMAKGLEDLETDKITISVVCPISLDVPLRLQLQIWEKLFKLSISVSVIDESDTGIEALLKSGNFQIAIGDITSSRQNASDFLSDLTDGGVFRFNSKKYRSIITRLSSVETNEDMIDGCFTAEDFIIKQGICYPLYSKSERFVVSGDADGITILDSENTISFIKARRFD